MEYFGNTDLLEFSKTAFLCSRKVPASVVLKCYDWAIAQREAGNCVISGFHSQIEKDVLHYLLKGSQPIIVVMASRLNPKPIKEFIKPFFKGQLLIVLPFDSTVKRVTKKTANIRNQLILELANEIAIGYKTPGGELEKLLSSNSKSWYTI